MYHKCGPSDSVSFNPIPYERYTPNTIARIWYNNCRNGKIIRLIVRTLRNLPFQIKMFRHMPISVRTGRVYYTQHQPHKGHRFWWLKIWPCPYNFCFIGEQIQRVTNRFRKMIFSQCNWLKQHRCAKFPMTSMWTSRFVRLKRNFYFWFHDRVRESRSKCKN